MDNLFGVSGRIGSGKDLLCEILQHLNWRQYVLSIGLLGKGQIGKFETIEERSNNTSSFKFETMPSEFRFENRKFADTMKDMACIMINCTRDRLENREFKEAIIPELGVSPREILQKLGTDFGRDMIGQNIWVATLLSQYDDTKKWIISDVRFPNEADAIKARGGIVLRIERPSIISNDQHESETALDNYSDFDWKITNDGSIQDLVDKVDEWTNW